MTSRRFLSSAQPNTCRYEQLTALKKRFLNAGGHLHHEALRLTAAMTFSHRKAVRRLCVSLFLILSLYVS
jgi:hypothetical protein